MASHRHKGFHAALRSHEYTVKLGNPFFADVKIGQRVRDGYHAVYLRFNKPVAEFVIKPSQVEKVKKGKGTFIITRSQIEKASDRWGYPRE